MSLIIWSLIIGFPIFKMCKEEGEEPAWMGFVPILNVVAMVKLANKPMWWVILCFIPCVNIVAGIIIWMAIAERRGKPSWMGLLMLVPCVNFIIPFYLAFAGE
ncbi:MAG: DUF5684 domain-containing protein [Fimbriimonadaceae bacterium]